MTVKKPLLATQPAKLLYTIYFILTALIKIPYYGLRYLVPALRPHRSWSYKLALMTKLVRLLFVFNSNTRISQARIKPSSEKEKKDLFVTLQPASPDLYLGPLSQSSTPIKPLPLNAVWHPRPPSSSSPPTSKPFTTLYLHGGAYILLSPQHPNVISATSFLASHLPTSTILCPEYRLATHPSCAFPAQLQDALTSYTYLVSTLSIPPENILLAADSAGAHLALSLLRYLHEHPVLPLPKAAVLFSPWLNLTPGACEVDGDIRRGSDYISSAFLRWGAEGLLPEGAEGAQRPSGPSGPDGPEGGREGKWISPGFHPWECRVPLWVWGGTGEVLWPDIEAWVGRMKGAGSRIEFEAAEGMVHDLLIVAGDMGMDKELGEGLGRAAGWVEGLE